MKKIAVFASGSGSNFQRIVEYFQGNTEIKVQILIVNNKDAYSIERAKRLGVKHKYIDREGFYNSTQVLDILKENEIDLIVLAGFLWLVPENLIDRYRIVNIHPALLPKYGGKGMYGDRVHGAVIENKEEESGITIHYVDPRYDEGEIIFQAKCKVDKDDTVESLAQKIHTLEHANYPRVIEEIILSK